MRCARRRPCRSRRCCWPRASRRRFRSCPRRCGGSSRSFRRLGPGLSATERRALEAVAAGAATPFGAFLAAQADEPAPFLGDAWFFRTLTTLGAGETRLLETSDGAPLPPAPPLGDPHAFGRLRLRVTRDGERVLGGEADRVELLGIDRWVGGTHLVPGAVWRWDAEASRLVAPQ